MTGLAFDLWDALMTLHAGRLQRDWAVRCIGRYD